MKKRLAILTLTLAIIFMSGCKSRKEEPVLNNDNNTTVILDEEVQDETKVKDILMENTELVEEYFEINPDTVGWLSVPGTLVDDVVVQSKVDNYVYFRKDYKKEYDYEGVYYVDWRADFKEGYKDELPLNTVIYGHAFTDNPDSDNYKVKFSSLHNLRDEELVKESPYIYLSTRENNYAFKIFAVFIVDAGNPDLPYNKPDADVEDFVTMVEDEVLPRSIWVYPDTEISNEDKFITLSTCVYRLEDDSLTGYPNTWYRYAVMGKLVDQEELALDEVLPDYNDDVILDKDSYPKQ